MAMLLDHPAILATDRAWGRFVRFVGGASRRRVGSLHAAADGAIGSWSAIEWERDLAGLANAQAEAMPETVDAATPEPAEPPADPEPTAADAGDATAADRRRAGAAILRAIMLARQRRFAEAEAAFADAAERDPDLDLARVPAFWELERGGQDAAVRALDAVGRRRDAMVLRARVENRYRPRIVRSA